ALVREFVECRRISLSHKIRPHSIPDHKDDVTRCVLSRRGYGEEAHSEGQQRSPGAWYHPAKLARTPRLPSFNHMTKRACQREVRCRDSQSPRWSLQLKTARRPVRLN